MDGTSAALGDGFLRRLNVKDAIQAAGLAIAWALLWKVAQIGGLQENASLWYPPSALTLAILVFGERRHVFLAFIGPTFHIVALNNFAAPSNSFWDIVVFYAAPPCAHVAGYYVGARILGRYKNEKITLSFIATFLLATITGALIAATLGAVSLKLRIGIPWNDFGLVLLKWWSGDFVGAITLTPLFVILLDSLPLVSRKTSGNPFTHDLNLRAILNYRFIHFVLIVLFLYISLLALKITIGTYIPYSLPILVATTSVLLIRDETGIEQISFAIALVGLVSSITASIANKLEFLIEIDFFLLVLVITALSALVLKDLRLQNVSLEKSANHDALTGLLNRAGFQAKVHDLTKNLGRRRLCYAILDLDNFKNVNHTYGHSAGDEALRKVASVLMRIFGQNVLCWKDRRRGDCRSYSRFVDARGTQVGRPTPLRPYRASPAFPVKSPLQRD